VVKSRATVKRVIDRPLRLHHWTAHGPEYHVCRLRHSTVCVGIRLAELQSKLSGKKFSSVRNIELVPEPKRVVFAFSRLVRDPAVGSRLTLALAYPPGDRKMKVRDRRQSDKKSCSAHRT